MAFPSDTGYKQLFSFPELARELLRAAVPQRWALRVRTGDFARVNSSYVSSHGIHRHDDIVWCIHRDRRPSFFMLVEFQSQPERWMATRMLGYAALLAEDLVKQRRATHGREPLLLPVVVYSGRKAWPYPTSFCALRPSAPPGLESLQPEQNYVLVSRSIGPGVISALLELDQADDEQTDVPSLIRSVDGWDKRQRNDELTRRLTAWVRMRLRAQFPAVDLPEDSTLEEMAMMFEHEFRNYTEVLEYRTLQRGRREGREEGLQEGRQEGRQEGLQEGQQEGARKALLAERQNFIRLLLKHAGMQPSPSGSKVLERASPEQMQEWINMLLETGQTPPELAAR